MTQMILGVSHVTTISFYGVRGSTPCSSPEIHRYGGNTSCVVLESPGQAPIVFDLGTGLRAWGNTVANDEPFTGSVLLTHLHWDHVQGLPFFVPIHKHGSSLDIYGPRDEGETLAESFSTFVNPPFFPIHYTQLAGELRFHDTSSDDMVIGDAVVRSRPVPHVGATNGYRVEIGGRVVSYISDHQQPVGRPTYVAPEVLELAAEADVLIHDAQFSTEEFEAHSDWGHCSVRYALEVAHQAKVRELVLFHHDPCHTDDIIDALLAEAITLAEGLDIGSVVAASEGLKISLD